MKLDASVQNLVGVGSKVAEKLQRLGIETVRDLLFYFPRAWQDFSKPQIIKSLRINEEVVIKASILSIRQTRTFKKRMSIVEAELVDDTGKIRAIWFNQAFLAKILKPGQVWIFAGKVGYDFKTGQKTLSVSQYEKDPIILPIYAETEGLTSKFLRRLIQPLLGTVEIFDHLPEKLKREEKLVGLEEAISKIHFPQNSNDIQIARLRLAFDELFLIALMVVDRRSKLSREPSFQMKIDESKLKEFVGKLPYKLTNAQRKTAWEIIQDLAKPSPMNRLLQGDVGSGKTVVAAMAAYVAALNKLQTVWLAPTEILANQHFQNISAILEPFNIKVGLMTAANKIADLKNDDVIIGTHALLQKDISFSRLGLIIIDEQHRFGVKQRAHLRRKSEIRSGSVAFNPKFEKECIPHLLSMTATPIPRSLALSVYGDLDLSIIDELPPGRKKVITKVVSPENRTKAYDFIQKEIMTGRQVFVICPLIEEGKSLGGQLFDLDRKTVLGEFEKLSKNIFPQFKIGILHGRMKSDEKKKTMDEFSAGKIQILVSTAVIEVGIDIANATVMMIEGAEKFGLAQLHQFRGRVGRGKFQSYCFLFSNSASEDAQKRLSAMTTSENGFELAEKDLSLRGPGELVGIRQSGLPDLKMASLSDIILVKRTRAAAERIYAQNVSNFPELFEKLKAYEHESHLE